MFGRLRAIRKRTGGPDRPDGATIAWVKSSPGSWLAHHFPGPRFTPPQDPDGERIEQLAGATNALGPQPLWEKYPDIQKIRTSDQIRTSREMGCLYAWLVKRRRPSELVEIGTGFGVSGMYWLSGLESNQEGELLTFEPNEAWARIAEANLAAIGTRFRLVRGTFEEQIDAHLGPQTPIDIIFIDGIHIGDVVVRQIETARRKLMPDALAVFDDIDFSPDMTDCWNCLAQESWVKASIEVNSHVGIIELF